MTTDELVAISFADRINCAVMKFIEVFRLMTCRICRQTVTDHWPKIDEQMCRNFTALGNADRVQRDR